MGKTVEDLQQEAADEQVARQCVSANLREIAEGVESGYIDGFDLSWRYTMHNGMNIDVLVRKNKHDRRQQLGDQNADTPKKAATKFKSN